MEVEKREVIVNILQQKKGLDILKIENALEDFTKTMELFLSYDTGKPGLRSEKEQWDYAFSQAKQDLLFSLVGTIVEN